MFCIRDMPTAFSPMGGLSVHTRKKTKDLMKLGNVRKIPTLIEGIAQSPVSLPKTKLAIAAKTLSTAAKTDAETVKKQPPEVFYKENCF